MAAISARCSRARRWLPRCQGCAGQSPGSPSRARGLQPPSARSPALQGHCPPLLALLELQAMPCRAHQALLLESAFHSAPFLGMSKKCEVDFVIIQISSIPLSPHPFVAEEAGASLTSCPEMLQPRALAGMSPPAASSQTPPCLLLISTQTHPHTQGRTPHRAHRVPWDLPAATPGQSGAGDSRKMVRMALLWGHAALRHRPDPSSSRNCSQTRAAHCVLLRLNLTLLTQTVL